MKRFIAMFAIAMAFVTINAQNNKYGELEELFQQAEVTEQMPTMQLVAQETNTPHYCYCQPYVAYPHEVSYRGSFGVNMGSLLEDEFNNPPFLGTITTEHGVLITKQNWNTSVFVGVGIGLDIWNYEPWNYYGNSDRETTLGLPVYATTNIIFNNKGSIQPYLKLSVGWEGMFVDTYWGNECYNYFTPMGEVGVSIPLGKPFALEVGVGYTGYLNDGYYNNKLGGTLRFVF